MTASLAVRYSWWREPSGRADESGGQGITITIISRAPGVETVVQEFRVGKPFMRPEPGPADSKN
jgi:hypothetical protein